MEAVQYCGDSISTVEVIQYCGGIASIHVGDSISTAEAVQYCRGIAAILYNGKISSETSSRNLHILFKTPYFFKLGMALQTSSWLTDMLQLNMPGLDH